MNLLLLYFWIVDTQKTKITAKTSITYELETETYAANQGTSKSLALFGVNQLFYDVNGLMSSKI